MPPSTTHSPGTVDGQSPPRMRPTFTTDGAGLVREALLAPGRRPQERLVFFEEGKQAGHLVHGAHALPVPAHMDRPAGDAELEPDGAPVGRARGEARGFEHHGDIGAVPAGDGRKRAVAARLFLDDELGLDAALEPYAQVLEDRERQQDGHDLALGVTGPPAVDDPIPAFRFEHRVGRGNHIGVRVEDDAPPAARAGEVHDDVRPPAVALVPGNGRVVGVFDDGFVERGEPRGESQARQDTAEVFLHAALGAGHAAESDQPAQQVPRPFRARAYRRRQLVRKPHLPAGSFRPYSRRSPPALSIMRTPYPFPIDITN